MCLGKCQNKMHDFSSNLKKENAFGCAQAKLQIGVSNFLFSKKDRFETDDIILCEVLP